MVVSPSGSSVALSSLPLPCSSFLHLPGWADQVEAFIKKGAPLLPLLPYSSHPSCSSSPGPYSCLVVLGSQPVPGEGVTRDLLVTLLTLFLLLPFLLPPPAHADAVDQVGGALQGGSEQVVEEVRRK